MSEPPPLVCLSNGIGLCDTALPQPVASLAWKSNPAIGPSILFSSNGTRFIRSKSRPFRAWLPGRAIKSRFWPTPL